MKAQERHKLKTNELAQFFSDLPEKFQKHGSLITSVALIVLIVLVGGIILQRYLAQGKLQQRDLLFDQMLAADILQLEALQRAQLSAELATEPANTILPYDASTITSTLKTIAENAQNDPAGMTAALLGAELALSQIYFSDQNITDDQKNNILQTARKIYQDTLLNFPNIPYAVGTAKIGLATIAEEQGQWEQARTQFAEVIALQDELLVGTIYPKLAQRRRELIDDVSAAITFPESKPVHAADFQMPELLPDISTIPPLDLPSTDPNLVQQPIEIAPPTQLPATEPNIIKPPTQIPVTDPNIIKPPVKIPVTDPNIIKPPVKIPVTDPNIIK